MGIMEMERSLYATRVVHSCMTVGAVPPGQLGPKAWHTGVQESVSATLCAYTDNTDAEKASVAGRIGQEGKCPVDTQHPPAHQRCVSIPPTAEHIPSHRSGPLQRLEFPEPTTLGRKPATWAYR